MCNDKKLLSQTNSYGEKNGPGRVLRKVISRDYLYKNLKIKHHHALPGYFQDCLSYSKTVSDHQHEMENCHLCFASLHRHNPIC